MNENLDRTLAEANETLAADARGDIIPVSETVVLTADAAEYGGNRTVTQVRTNHQLTMSDRLAVYKDKAWHGLGDVIGDELTGGQAVERFIGWRVQEHVVTTVIDGATKVLPLKAQVRSDTRELLGVVSDGYQTIQNQDIGDFADALLAEAKAEGVNVRMETCGSLLGGRKVFLTLRPDREIRVGRTGEDVTVPLLTVLNGHDGSLAMTAAWTHVRVVCNNTFATALGDADKGAGEGRTFRIRHMGQVKDYLQQAKACLGIAVKGLEHFQIAATAMSTTKLGKDALADYFGRVYESLFGAAPEVLERLEAYETRKDAVLRQWNLLMGDDANLIDGLAGTLWAAFNAVTAWQDHVRVEGGRVKTADRQQHVKLLGAAAVDKRKAFKAAMQLV